MSLLAHILVGFVAFEHVYFMILEAFLWQKPIGLKTFRMTAEKAATTAQLAQNQGLYNGFLAAGLIWGLIIVNSSPTESLHVRTFFLACVIVAGIVGAMTVNMRIFFIQSIPAVLALAAVWLSR